MNQLVAQHVIGFLQRAGKRQYDAALQGLRHPARSLTRRAADLGRLFEMRMAGIHEKRLPPPQLVVEQLRQPGVPAFRHAPRLHDCLAFLFVVVDIEMLGLQYLEVEVVVADHVLPESLLAEPGAARRQERYCSEGNPRSYLSSM